MQVPVPTFRQLALGLLLAMPLSGLFAQSPVSIVCGDPALESTFCYHDNMDTTMVYQGTGSYAIALLWNGGQMESCCDNITIYDGLNTSAPVLYSGNNGGASMAGIMAISTNTDHALTMVFQSDVSVNCGSMGWPQLDWTVACLDCTAPQATYTVNTDCAAQNFTIDVDVSVLGSDTLLDITNNAGAATVTATDTGVYTVGPFPITTQVSLTLVNDSNSLCSVHSPILTNPLCASLVVCGDPPVDVSYCYTNSDSHTWHWQSSTGSALSILFSAGTIESANYDHLRIYNGPDNNAPLLFDHTMTQQENLAGYQFTASSGEIYMEMTSDGSVSCADGNQTEWAWQVGCLDCTPPVATYSINTDCAAQNFTIDVDVSVLGSDTTLDIINDAGAATMTATDTGVYTVGPFPITTEVHLTLVNDSNSLCSVHSPTLVNPLCATNVICGDSAQAYTYCYGDNTVHAWHWHNTTPGMPLSMIFTAGYVDYFYGTFGDQFVIYDGADNTAPVLFTPPLYNSYDLTGLQVTSTGTDIYMEIISDGYGSCQSYGYQAWAWTIGCYDCTPPVATYSINTDCIAQTYTIDVNLSALGSDSTLDITNNAGAAMVTATDTGTWTVGPFPVATEVTLTLTNDSNSLCTVHSPVLVNPLCPTDVNCGDTALAYTYCYGNNAVHAWHWHNTTPGTPLSMIFTAGFVDYFYGTFGDHFVIYDGASNTAPVLFTPPLYNNYDLTGLQVISTGTDIYMEITSDGYGSCQDYGYQAWAWTVGCYDCTPPVATFSVVTDCDSMQYHVAVNITTMGSDPVIDITNDNGVPPVPASAAGTYSVGPFPAGTHTTVTLASDVNSFCSVNSGSLTNPLCPTVLACGADPVTETYCYTNYDNHTWHWQCGCGSPLSLQFSAGSIETNAFDHLTIYDGPDNNSPILFQHGSVTEDLSGLLVVSTGSDIYMEMSSDGSVSCGDGSQDSWTWTVGCLDCTNPEATFSVVPDCQHATYQVAVNVTNTGSSDTVRIANTASLDTLSGIPSGITLVGPISMDSVSVLTVLNATNGLCKVVSPAQSSPFAECIVPVDGAQNFTYCYTNTDTSYFAYQCTNGLPIAITFHAGQLLVNDYVQIYDSAGVSPNVLIFQGNYSGNMAGHSWNSTNPEHALVMRVVSDGTYSCTSGDATVPLNWTVECGYAGIEEQSTGNFTMYPNPATRELYMRLPGDTHGSTEVKILDVSGRTVYQNIFIASGAELNTFDLHNLQSGNYSVVVTTPNWVKAQNLQIIR